MSARSDMYRQRAADAKNRAAQAKNRSMKGALERLAAKPLHDKENNRSVR